MNTKHKFAFDGIHSFQIVYLLLINYKVDIIKHGVAHTFLEKEIFTDFVHLLKPGVLTVETYQTYQDRMIIRNNTNQI